MEKYRRFADHGTGIQAFIPPLSKRSDGFATRFVVTPAVLAVKLPFVFLFGVCALLFGLLLPAAVGVAVPALAQALRNIFLKPALGGLLLSLGVFRKDVFWPLTAGAAAGVADARPAAGSVVVTNFASYVDVLLHGARHAPVFAFAREAAEGGGAEARVLTRGLVGALTFATLPYTESVAAFDGAGTLKDAVDEAVRRSAPLVLFFEGTPTNGKGVLAPPQRLLHGCDGKATTFHLQATVYDTASSAGNLSYSLTYPSLGCVKEHVYRLVATPTHTVKTVTVAASKTPQFATLPDYGLLLTSLVAKLCEASGIRAMAIGRKDKNEFLEHWHSTQGSSYAK